MARRRHRGRGRAPGQPYAAPGAPDGYLYLLPGTHRQARLDPARGVYVNAGIGPKMNELFKAYPEWKSIPSVAGPMKAGTCSFHNGLTAHGAGANMTAGGRRAMTIPYMPDGTTFSRQRNVLRKEKFEALRIGDPLNDDSINPLVWSKHKHR